MNGNEIVYSLSGFYVGAVTSTTWRGLGNASWCTTTCSVAERPLISSINGCDVFLNFIAAWRVGKSAKCRLNARWQQNI